MRDQVRLPLRKKLNLWMKRSRILKLSCHRLLMPSFRPVNPYICDVVLRHRGVALICFLSSLWHLVSLVYDFKRLPVIKESSTSNFIMLPVVSPFRLSLLVYTTHTRRHARTHTYEAHGTVANVISSVNPPQPTAVLKVENRNCMPVRGLKPSSPYSYLSSSSAVLPVRVGYFACQMSAFQAIVTKTLYLRYNEALKRKLMEIQWKGPSA